jgi:DNA (cytosine-5)-methyltransferase 1
MITVTDLFSGAGGSTTGAIQVPGVMVRIAANHFQIVTDIHALNHPDTDHAVVDLHLERPSFFPKTDMLWASPECTKWSQANGAKMPAIDEGLFEDPLSDDAKTRSRLLMFDVLRFIEYHRYRLVIVENVVDIATQAQYRTAWTIWRQELRALGYAFRVVSLNSMHAQMLGAPAPQSRDRIYIVAWPEGEKAPDLDQVVSPRAFCFACDAMVDTVQSFKAKRDVGRYRQTYIYCCPHCGGAVEPGWMPAASAIDWSILGERVGNRLKPKTRARLAAGIARYWGPMHLEAAGNTYDSADPNHVQHGDPDAYMRVWPTSDPAGGTWNEDARPSSDPLRTITTRDSYALVQSYYGNTTEARPVTDPLGTLTTVDRYALIHRNNTGGAEMTTPVTEELRTLTTAGHQSVIQAGTRSGRPHVSPADLKAAVEMVPDVLFRMFQPHEVAAGMAFPADYKWQPPDRNKPISNRDLVKAAGNAVTPPSARDLVAACIESLGYEIEHAA